MPPSHSLAISLRFVYLLALDIFIWQRPKFQDPRSHRRNMIVSIVVKAYTYNGTALLG